MQVFKAYMKIVKKKIPSIIVYFAIFIGISIAMTQAGSESERKDFAQTELKIAIENLDDGELSKALVDYLQVNHEVTERPETEDELLDAIFCRKLDYVLYIPAGFTEKFLAGEREGSLRDRKVPQSSSGMFADSQVEGFLSTLGVYLDAGFSVDESIKNTMEDYELSVEVAFLNGENAAEKHMAVYYFQYLPYIFISTIILAIGPVLLVFLRRDINARNKCSSVSFQTRNLWLIGGSIVVALAEYLFLMAIGICMYPDYILTLKGAVGAFNAFLSLLFALSVTFLFAQIVKKENALNMVSNVCSLTLAFLGGIFVPLDIFGENVLKVSKFIPTYWYVTANDAIAHVTKFSEITDPIWHGFAIQGIYAVALLTLGMLINRIRARE